MNPLTAPQRSQSFDTPALGRLLVLAAALMWSTSGLFAKAPIFDAWPDAARGPLLAFWRALFAGLLLIPAVRRPRWRMGLVPMVLAFAGMNVAYMTAMSLTTAANAIWLQSTSPLWIFVIGALLLREQVARRETVPLLFGACGVGFILAFELREQASLGNLCGLAAGICYAGVALSIRRLRDENGPWLVALNHLFAAAILLPYVITLARWPSPVQLVVLAAFGLLQMGVPYMLFARGLRSISAQEAAAIALVEPVVTPLWVFLAWGERPAWWTLCGGGLILVGLSLRYFVMRANSGPAAGSGDMADA